MSTITSHMLLAIEPLDRYVAVGNNQGAQPCCKLGLLVKTANRLDDIMDDRYEVILDRHHLRDGKKSSMVYVVTDLRSYWAPVGATAAYALAFSLVHCAE